MKQDEIESTIRNANIYVNMIIERYSNSLSQLNSKGFFGLLKNQNLKTRAIEEKNSMSAEWKAFRKLVLKIEKINITNFSNVELRKDYSDKELISFPNNGEDLLIDADIIKKFEERLEIMKKVSLILNQLLNSTNESKVA